MIPTATLRAPWWRRLLARIRSHRLGPTCGTCARYFPRDAAAREFFHGVHSKVERFVTDAARFDK